MRQIKILLKYGGFAVGFLMSTYAIVSAAKEVQTWQLPVWAWYAIGLFIICMSATFIIVGFWQENRRLRGRETKAIHKDIVNERQVYGKARHLPQKLVELHKYSQAFMKQLKISKKEWESVQSKLKQSIGIFRIVALTIILKMPVSIVARMKPMQNTAYKIMFDVDAALKDAGINTLSQDDTYKQCYDEIDTLSQGLPPQIIQTITTYILMANILDMTFVFRLSQPFMKNSKVPLRLRMILPYQTLAVDSQLGKLNGQVANLIIKFLAGGDL